METLTGKKCNNCNFHMLNPSFACPNCGSDSLSDFVFSGKGKVYTYTVVLVGFGHLAEKAPYILAVVELQEGLKVITIVEDLEVDKIKIDLPVTFKHWDEKTGPIFKAA